MTSEFIDRPLPREQRIETLVAAFEHQFGRPPEGITEAPGRVNLIGEHVDYNDGLVLPFAIDRSVLVAYATRERTDSAYSVDFNERIDDDGISPIMEGRPRGHWGFYWRGTATVLAEFDRHRNPIWQYRGQRPRGIELAMAGDVPVGAGLSSSAAFEVAVAGAYREAFAWKVDNVILAQACHFNENRSIGIGVRSGIMDQFASALSTRNHALLLDCRSEEFSQRWFSPGEDGHAIVIANSAVQRQLTSSAYNERRAECEEAVVQLRTRLERPGLQSLRDVSVDDITQVEIDTLPLRRARHVVSEITRVTLCAGRQSVGGDSVVGDSVDLGEYMNQSHRSLRDDYEVSSPELDLLVGLATAQEYVLGARLTGAGFGGCTVNLVRADAVEAFARDVIGPYRERTGLPAVMYVTSPQDGLHIWRREGNGWVLSA